AAREIAREARARETDGRALVAAAGVEIRALRPEERTAWTEALAPALSERTKVIGAGYVDAALRSNQ
ncbi:MAG: C4-dicarboxylate ABC transporter, partial [Pseudomonadota bacterium]